MSRIFIACFAFSVLLVATACSKSQSSHEAASSLPAPSSEAPSPLSASGPESSKSENWKYIVNSALRAAEKYATSRNPNAVFFGPSVETKFLKQIGGEYEGHHLLMITNTHAGNTSFAMLLPLFDENSSLDHLDDSGELWRVVSAKFNGREF